MSKLLAALIAGLISFGAFAADAPAKDATGTKASADSMKAKDDAKKDTKKEDKKSEKK